MKDKTHRRSSGLFTAVRKLGLAAEILFLSLFVLGGSRIVRTEQEKRTDKESLSQKEQENTHVTPEFHWTDHTTIAHALGAIEDKTYLNSRESFIINYEKGCRLFELDLTKTSDGVWVCRHSWNNSLGQWKEEGKKVLTSGEFLSSPLYGEYTPMTFQDLMVLLKDYPDAFVLLDSKQYSVRNYQRTLEDFGEYLQIAKEADAQESLDQLIPEIYNEAMFPGTALMYDFPAYLYSLWQDYSMEELRDIAVFCREKGIAAATIAEKNWSEGIQQIFDEEGILLYIYTVNDKENARTYLENGAAGVCTDTLLKEDLLQK